MATRVGYNPAVWRQQGLAGHREDVAKLLSLVGVELYPGSRGGSAAAQRELHRSPAGWSDSPLQARGFSVRFGFLPHVNALQLADNSLIEGCRAWAVAGIAGLARGRPSRTSLRASERSVVAALHTSRQQSVVVVVKLDLTIDEFSISACHLLGQTDLNRGPMAACELR